MKKMMVILLLVLLVLFLLLFPQESEDKELELPELTLINLEGEKICLQELTGKRELLLLFWHPEIESSLQQFNILIQHPPPATLVAVALGNFPPADLKRVIGDLHPSKVLIDKETKLSRTLEVYSLPSLLLFDRAGLLKKRYSTLLKEEELEKIF